MVLHCENQVQLNRDPSALARTLSDRLFRHVQMNQAFPVSISKWYPRHVRVIFLSFCSIF